MPFVKWFKRTALASPIELLVELNKKGASLAKWSCAKQSLNVKNILTSTVGYKCTTNMVLQMLELEKFKAKLKHFTF